MHRCNAGDTRSCAITIKIRLQIVPTLSRCSARIKEAGMSVDPLDKSHHQARVTVADGSAGVPSKPDSARHKPGIANSPDSTLPAVESDPMAGPKRALSRDIDVGLGDIRSGKFTAGETRIANGIRNVVMYLTGKNSPAYAEAKRATGEILLAYSRRPPADVMEVFDGVISYLQNIVVYDFLLAADSTRLGDALETAKKYVTDAGPDSRARTDRLESMIVAMKDAGVSQPIRNATRMACEEAIRSKP
jgi:hypothetical protein